MFLYFSQSGLFGGYTSEVGASAYLYLGPNRTTIARKVWSVIGLPNTVSVYHDHPIV